MESTSVVCVFVWSHVLRHETSPLPLLPLSFSCCRRTQPASTLRLLPTSAARLCGACSMLRPYPGRIRGTPFTQTIQGRTMPHSPHTLSDSLGCGLWRGGREGGREGGRVDTHCLHVEDIICIDIYYVWHTHTGGPGSISPEQRVAGFVSPHKGPSPLHTRTRRVRVAKHASPQPMAFGIWRRAGD